jgi:hypothetical protein
MPTTGTVVKYCDASGNFKAAQVVSDQGLSITVDVYSDGGTWADGTHGGVIVRRFSGVTLGSGVGQYQMDLSSMGSLAGTSDLSAVNSSMQTLLGEFSDPQFGNSALLSAVTNCVVSPIAGSTISLALNTSRNPSTIRNDGRSTRVRVSGTWTSLVTGTGIVELRSDSNTPPTTVRDNQTPGMSSVVAITVPWSLEYDVPAGHNYLVATSGVGTFTITHINETVQ